MDNRTPDLSTVIREALDIWSSAIRVMMPGKIISYDKDKQLADVQPMLQETLSNGDLINLPEIKNVPVQWFRVGLAVIYMPLRPDDLVMLIFSDKSLDKWEGEDNDGLTAKDPQDVRSHDLSDAIAVPGLYPPGVPIPNVDPADMRLILFDSSGNVRSQFYLGGDTGDIVELPERYVMLGSKELGDTEFAVLGTALTTLLNTMWKIQLDGHWHADPIAGITGPALYPGAGLTPMSATELATKVKLK